MENSAAKSTTACSTEMSGRPLSIHQVKPLWSVPLTTSRSQAFNEPYIRRICSNRPNPAKPNLRASACAQSSRASSAADAWCDFARWSSLSVLGHRAEAVLPHLALRASVLKATGAAIRSGIAISDIGLCGHCRCQCRTEGAHRLTYACRRVSQFSSPSHHH